MWSVGVCVCTCVHSACFCSFSFACRNGWVRRCEPREHNEEAASMRVSFALLDTDTRPFGFNRTIAMLCFHPLRPFAPFFSVSRRERTEKEQATDHSSSSPSSPSLLSHPPIHTHSLVRAPNDSTHTTLSRSGDALRQPFPPEHSPARLQQNGARAAGQSALGEIFARLPQHARKSKFPRGAAPLLRPALLYAGAQPRR